MSDQQDTTFLFDTRVKECTRCKSVSITARSMPVNMLKLEGAVWCCGDCGKTGYIRDLPLLKTEEPKKSGAKGKAMALAGVLMAAHAAGALDAPTVESLVESQMKGRRRR